MRKFGMVFHIMYLQHVIYLYFDHLRNFFTNYRHIINNKDVFTKTATNS
jgi:hypothetical protein